MISVSSTMAIILIVLLGIIAILTVCVFLRFVLKHLIDIIQNDDIGFVLFSGLSIIASVTSIFLMSTSLLKSSVKKYIEANSKSNVSSTDNETTNEADKIMIDGEEYYLVPAK